jgi:hypothetical protein
VRGIGNVLRHEYQGLSDPSIWKVVTDELPRLKFAIRAVDAAPVSGSTKKAPALAEAKVMRNHG